MSRKLMWAVPFALLAGVLVFVLAKGFGNDPRSVPFMLQGKPAPAFSLRSLNTGEVMTLEKLKGRPVVMNFWATYCGPCKLEHPVLEWGHRNLGQKAQFVGVAFDDTEENARRYLAQNGASFPQLLDERGQLAVEFGTTGVPETYFIDAAGVIVHKHIGPIDPETLVGWVQRLAGLASTSAGGR
ncbi:MAG: redoxin family protein [Myxococcaceae bacterium]|nr:redoxin family protein [Myxococcaceae bacterium]MCI0670330.1 redoxin family protein [Myxococcaceae bacterium]